METKWHLLSKDEVISKLDTSIQGLASWNALERLKRYGPNALPETKGRTILSIFFGQFNSPLIALLFVASIIIYAIGEATDALIILIILLFNAIVGTIQEGKAENTLNALKSFVDTKATVLRGGSEHVISDDEVVPGDIIDLREGDKIPADARVVISLGLKTDEASLTGESEPVDKMTEKIKEEAVIVADQNNMVFRGTHIVAGSGRAVVVATGTSTVIGRLAKELSSIDTEIPLKTDIRNLSKAIIYVTVAISVLLLVLGIVRGESIRDMFITVVSLSVSIIPEGLPIVMTLVLATGVWRMGKQNALVKKLQAVEALGQARIIAVDKTGTITKNELVVREAWTAGRSFAIDGVGYEPSGHALLDHEVVDAADHPELLMLGKLTALCSNARVSYSDSERRWNINGDPTEAAMVVFATKIGFRKEDLVRENPLTFEVPFDHIHKYRAVEAKLYGNDVLITIGAPEVLLEPCRYISDPSGEKVLSPKDRETLLKILSDMSGKGERVVAVCYHKDGKRSIDNDIEGLTFVGFLGMQDVLRPEAKEAVTRAIEAGVRVVMITGDHKITARSIASEAGIYHEGDDLMTGNEIDVLDDRALQKRVSRVSVFARVTPEHKLRIIGAFKARGEKIAMTGDGVNDAPSLVAADLGVAMGGIGTEVAKEAADIVLLDDNLDSIVSAIEEGRSIYKTIKKVILYLFSTSLGEVLTIVGGLILGLPLPVLAAQIIWLNFVTDGFLDVALAMEPKESGLLHGKFERPKKYLVDSLMLQRMFIMAIPMMIGALTLFSIYLDIDRTKAWTVSLTVLAVFQWFNAWNCRSDSKSIFVSNPSSNKYLMGATCVVISLQVLAVYAPFMQTILHTVPLSLTDWAVIIPMAFTIVIAEEIRKVVYRVFNRRIALLS